MLTPTRRTWETAMLLECHITVDLDDAELAQLVADELHWKTSEIERDPLLGQASYFYLTTHDTELVRLMSRMRSATAVLKSHAVRVVREKIELIIYDTKGRA